MPSDFDAGLSIGLLLGLVIGICVYTVILLNIIKRSITMEQGEKVRCVAKLPGKPPITVNMNFDDMGKFIGGYIQCTYVDKKFGVYYDEDGTAKKLPFNMNVAGRHLVGPILVTQFDGEGNSVHLEDEHVTAWMNRLKEDNGYKDRTATRSESKGNPFHNPKSQPGEPKV